MNQQLTGLPAWLVQRLSALYMTLYCMLAAIWWLTSPELDFERWRSLFHQPVAAISTAMFLLALLLHAWVGMRDVILDYAGRVAAIRLLLLTLLGGWLIALAFWSVRIMLTGMLL